VGMAVQASLGVTVGRLVAGQVPDDQSLVTGGGEEHVGTTIAVSTIVVHIAICKLFEALCSRGDRRTSPRRWPGR
jgi:hypothetical protein